MQPAARRQLYNLHGSDREKFWYGQDGGKYPPAMSPDAVASLGQQGRVAGALVVSQACYGAFLLMPGGLRSVRDACSLQFLELGAAGFLGSTTIAYGGTTGAMVCSDVLAVEFLRAASQGLPLGQALQQARRGLASSVRSPPGGAELKTLLQFVLYGDPTRTWITAAAPKTLAGGVESLTGDAETRALFAEYAAWSEEAAAPKTLGARAEGFDEGWTETARFSAGAGPKGLLSAESATRPQRRVLQKVNELPREDVLRDGASSHRVVYFREVVTRADGSTQDAVSTGGRSAATIEEERGGAAPWWRQPALAATGPATGRPKRGAPAPKAKRKPARSASKKRGSAARPKKGRSKR